MRSSLAVAQAGAYVGDQVVAEARLLLAVEPMPLGIHPTAFVHPRRPRSAPARRSAPTASSARTCGSARGCRIGASVVVDGITEIGDETEIFPMASIGLAPQDLKYHGEPTRLTIGRRNIFREFVTINRGTADRRRRDQPSATTTCSWPTCTWRTTATIGSGTIFGPHATLGGHVHVEDFANISAGSRRAPVLPGRPPCLHRRLFGGDQGRAAVRADHRQPAGPRLRRQQHRADAARLHAGRRGAAAAGLPLPAAVEAEHHRPRWPGSRTTPSWRRRRCACWWISSATRSAA